MLLRGLGHSATTPTCPPDSADARAVKPPARQAGTAAAGRRPELEGAVSAVREARPRDHLKGLGGRIAILAPEPAGARDRLDPVER